MELLLSSEVSDDRGEEFGKRYADKRIILLKLSKSFISKLILRVSLNNSIYFSWCERRLIVLHFPHQKWYFWNDLLSYNFFFNNNFSGSIIKLDICIDVDFSKQILTIFSKFCWSLSDSWMCLIFFVENQINPNWKYANWK